MNTSIAIEEDTSAKVLNFKSPFQQYYFTVETNCFEVFLIKNSSIKIFAAAKRSSFKMFVVFDSCQKFS